MRTRRLEYFALFAAVLGVATPWRAIEAHAPRTRTAGHRVTRLAYADAPDRLALVAGRASRSRASTATVDPSLQVRPAPGKITGPYGERRGNHIHPGIDIDGNTGDPVVAAMHGTVSWAGLAPKGWTGYGLLVVVDHDGFQTGYAHLSHIDVSPGQVVDAGQLVGEIGATGIATGSHLHFEVRVDGKHVNPKLYFPNLF